VTLLGNAGGDTLIGTGSTEPSRRWAATTDQRGAGTTRSPPATGAHTIVWAAGNETIATGSGTTGSLSPGGYLQRQRHDTGSLATTRSFQRHGATAVLMAVGATLRVGALAGLTVDATAPPAASHQWAGALSQAGDAAGQRRRRS